MDLLHLSSHYRADNFSILISLFKLCLLHCCRNTTKLYISTFSLLIFEPLFTLLMLYAFSHLLCIIYTQCFVCIFLPLASITFSLHLHVSSLYLLTLLFSYTLSQLIEPYFLNVPTNYDLISQPVQLLFCSFPNICI